MQNALLKNIYILNATCLEICGRPMCYSIIPLVQLVCKLQHLPSVRLVLAATSEDDLQWTTNLTIPNVQVIPYIPNNSSRSFSSSCKQRPRSLVYPPPSTTSTMIFQISQSSHMLPTMHGISTLYSTTAQSTHSITLISMKFEDDNI